MFTMDQLGFGTTQFWYGTDRTSFSCMLKAVREYGIRMIDTAEMYGHGECEKAVGRLVNEAGRDSLYLIDKILPENAHKKSFFKSLDRSLSLLNTDCIDLYLLHWRENADLAEMSTLMEEATAQGKIREWGVSNFDVKDMEDLLSCRDGIHCKVNQIFYNPLHRGIEYDLMPMMKEKNIRLMSYSSLDTRAARNRLQKDIHIKELLAEENISVEALMLRFNLEHGVSALFQTSSPDHLAENLRNLDFDYERYIPLIDTVCPPPSRRITLEKR